MTRHEMMLTMPAVELRQWMLLEGIQPLEDGYWQSAMVAKTVYDGIDSFSKRRTHRPLSDFMPKQLESPADDAAAVKAAGERLMARIDQIGARRS